jgi:hypothetical protein
VGKEIEVQRITAEKFNCGGNVRVLDTSNIPQGREEKHKNPNKAMLICEGWLRTRIHVAGGWRWMRPDLFPGRPQHWVILVGPKVKRRVRDVICDANDSPVFINSLSFFCQSLSQATAIMLVSVLGGNGLRKA